jgi:selenocysteine lyase/cysteine desulfurase
MTASRRNFIKQAAVGLFAGGQLTDSLANSIPKLGEVDDEEMYWKLMRQQFPLTNKRIYLNNGTMGPSPYPVIQEMNRAMTETDVNGSYGGWENSHKIIGDFVGADETEIALTMNVTQGINIVCWGLPLKKGDEVIITTHEHGGNALPWLNRAMKDGIVLKPFTPAMTAEETLQRIQSTYTSKTKVIAVPHILCTQGQILPVKEIANWARSKGLFVFFDGAHGPGMVQLNLKEMGCDAYASCCHKWMLGPKGTGFLYVRKDVQQTLVPIFIGAGSDKGLWNMNVKPPMMGALADTAHRYYGGTMNNALFKGVDASISFINQIGMNNIQQRLTSLAGYAQQQLIALGDKIEMLTPTEEKSRGGVIGFRIKTTDSKTFYERCQKESITIRQVHENGLNSLRLSTHIYNNKTEIDKLIALVKDS